VENAGFSASRKARFFAASPQKMRPNSDIEVKV
jgi:hypothetical protein